MKDLKLKESVIFERSREGRRGYSLPEEDLKGAENILPAELRSTGQTTGKISRRSFVHRRIHLKIRV